MPGAGATAGSPLGAPAGSLDLARRPRIETRHEPDPISLRPIAPPDLPFPFEFYASTREEEFTVVPWDASGKVAFLRMQFEARDRSYRARFPGASFDLIPLEGRPVGRLLVDRAGDEIRVIDITLHREARGAGIGGTLLGNLIAEATLAGKPVRLHVDRANRAYGPYRRLGFRTTAEGDRRLIRSRPARIPISIRHHSSPSAPRSPYFRSFR